MSERDEHEQGLALFLEPAHRARFRESLQAPKLREKLRAKLFHFAWRDVRYAKEIRSGDAEEIAHYLLGLGAPATCFAVSSNESLDGREVPLLDALRQVVGDDDGTLLSCVPGRLGLYSGEAPTKETVILERRA